MKNKYAFIFLTVLCAVFACEQIDESALAGGETVEKVQMSFTGVIENDADTKTVLADGDNAKVKKVLWQPGDEIAVSPEVDNRWDSWAQVSRFTSTLSSSAATSEFDGSAAFAARYTAFYPYSETVRDSSNVFLFELPATQKYVSGSFDPQTAPMVAYAERGNDFEFRNVCGIVAFKLTGSEAVKSITFSGTDATGSHVMLAGIFEVNPASEEPVMKLHTYSSGCASLTLDCVEPVQLNESTATPFYMMLPPATYAEFSLIITTADGEIMLKSGKNLTVARSHIKPTGELEYVESEYIDLSAKGTANSYIVPAAGLYSFKADVVGNGAYGYVEGENFYPATPDITPSNVKLLWEEKPGTVSNLALKDGKLNFMASGIEGNALIAVTDDSDKILWSWHIWVTDQPQEQTYVNDKGTFHVLDRNIGATRADRGTGEEWKASRGLLYQWGRKDPFMQKGYSNSYTTQLYMYEVVEEPTHFIRTSHWALEWSQKLWSSETKTIYDPCPIGYRVAVSDIWDGFVFPDQDGVRVEQINVSGSYDKGWKFRVNRDNPDIISWYPATNVFYWGDGNYEYDYLQEWSGSVWSSESDGYNSFHLRYSYNNTKDMSVLKKTTAHPGNGMPVRCMKDSGYEVTKMPQVEFNGVTDVTTTSVKLNAKVTSEGWGSVTDRGFIWGTTSDLGSGQKVSCDKGSGAFSHVLTGLSSGTVYYAKAYVTNASGTAYSDVQRFFTNYIEDAENLSGAGTANCYQIRPVAGTYSFDARYKGNSTETISPASVEVLWEVDGYRNVCDNIIDSPSLSDGQVVFNVPDDVVPGNALIAVKNSSGKIIWSWHIWVADFDPMQTQHLYESSNAVFMDRNLGAVVNAPDFNDLGGTWASAYGMIYQWGRKDPLVKSLMPTEQYYAFTSIDEANANPTTFAASVPWLSSSVADLWQPEKTMYDPCPVGWKVPSYEEINGMWYYGEFSSYGLKMSVNNNQTSWFGFGDYIHSGGDYYLNNGNTYYWTTNYQPNWNNVRTLYLYNGQGSSDMSPTDAYPVRCMKDE